jgi:hypothetical protein
MESKCYLFLGKIVVSFPFVCKIGNYRQNKLETLDFESINNEK